MLQNGVGQRDIMGSRDTSNRAEGMEGFPQFHSIRSRCIDIVDGEGRGSKIVNPLQKGNE